MSFPPKLPPGLAPASFAGLDTRSATILRELVEVYVQTGEPVGSRTLTRRLPLGLSPGALQQAGNYLNARLAGGTLEETRTRVADEIAANRTALDTLTQEVVEAGVATWTGGGGAGSLILRGQAKLLQNLDQAARVQEI